MDYSVEEPQILDEPDEAAVVADVLEPEADRPGGEREPPSEDDYVPV
jgi:hypothetical protein